MTTIDGVLLWLRATVARAGRLVNHLTRAELVLAATLCACTIIAGIGAIARPELTSIAILAATALVTIGLVPPVIVDAVIMRDNLRRSGAAMVKVNTSKPTGAPRVAEVRCKHGDPHRFVYGPSGWEAAGPGVVPESEEVPAP